MPHSNYDLVRELIRSQLCLDAYYDPSEDMFVVDGTAMSHKEVFELLNMEPDAV